MFLNILKKKRSLWIILINLRNSYNKISFVELFIKFLNSEVEKILYIKDFNFFFIVILM